MLKKTESSLQDLPSNNKEPDTVPGPTLELEPEAPKPEPDPEPIPTSFEISKEGVNELIQALNEVVTGKYVKQVLFNVLNTHLKPITKKV